MAHVKVSVDNRTIMDSGTGEWTTNPPKILAEQLGPNHRPEPWMRALLLTLAEAGMTDQDTTITVHTKPHQWTLTCETP